MNISRAHIAAVFAFSFWGLFPLYWHIFSEVGAWDLFAHRFVWSFFTLIIILGTRKELYLIKNIWATPKQRSMLILSAVLISSNWLLYIYAINSGQVLEASMGYFLNPLFNVFMGWILLKEKIRITQWPAILLALLAILIIAFQGDINHFPWLALSLSITFALYGLIRKLVHVGALEGLAFETSVMILPVLACWYFQETTPLSILQLVPFWKIIVLSLSGFITCLPLVLFAYSARRLPLRDLGFIQYLSPSFKFLCGLVVLHETLRPERLQAFGLIWIALIWYTIESFYFIQKSKKVVIPISE